MKRILLSLGIFSLALLSIQAQVITWSVKPGVYSKIEPCWGDLYYVYNSNGIGIINGDGEVLVSPKASRITGFYGGLALVLKADGGKERILCILSVDGSYSNVDGTYYTISNQEFFSEGLLTVSTPKGQTGYMNVNGVLVKSFDDSYISPFSEGYAVVGEQQDFCIIDKRFDILQIPLPSVSPLWGGANVYHGTAIVWDGNGNFYEFNPKRGTCDAIKDKSVKNALKSFDFNYDYLGGIATLTKRSELVVYEQPVRSSETLPVTKQGNKYGYDINGKTILPIQFEQAENFYGNHAIVKTNGKFGLLSFNNINESFEAKAEANIKYRKSSSKDIPHKFGITIPSQWNADDITVSLKDNSGSSINISGNGNSYIFKSDGATGTKKYKVEIDGGGMRLWQGEIAFNYEVEAEPVISHDAGTTAPQKPLTVSLKATNTQADKNNRCYVKVIISNPNTSAVTTIVSMTGSNLLTPVKQTVTVPAHGTKEVSTYFTLANKIHKGHVSASTTSGGSASLDLQLIPL